MKIAITGSAGIGKTTLANALSKRYEVPLILEDMKPVLRALNVVQTAKEDTRLAAQKSYMHACEQWLKNRDVLQAQPHFVADRCAIDILARWLTSGVFREQNQFLVNLINICKRQIVNLDLIVVPPLLILNDVPKQNEAGLVRQTSLTLKLHSHSLTRGLLEQLINVPKLYLPPEAVDLDTRVNIVTQTLKHLGKI